MDYTVERMNGFSVIGFEKRISNKTAFSDCPAFWAEFMQKHIKPITQHNVPENEKERAIVDNRVGELGVCICNGDDTFSYIIAGIYKGGAIPKEMTLYKFPDTLWLKFKTKGLLPESIQQLNTEIFMNWLPENKEWDLAMGANIEWYSEENMDSPDYECGIWVPVKKKL